jgi:hypothetical protein
MVVMVVMMMVVMVAQQNVQRAGDRRGADTKGHRGDAESGKVFHGRLLMVALS